MFCRKFIVVLFAIASFAGARAHYCWPSVDQTPAWDVVRRTDNYETRNPIKNVTDPNFRCYNSGRTAPNTYSIEAGNKITFHTDNILYHIGVLNVYMAKAPGKAIDFDGFGNVWFKIYEISAHADPLGNVYPTFPADMLHNVTFTIPKNVPSGQYLLRIEHIALHDAYYFGGAQFYIACAQLDVTNGGNGSPRPLVSIPGVYTGHTVADQWKTGKFLFKVFKNPKTSSLFHNLEPGIIFDPYAHPKPTSYKQPGPAVWSG